MKIIFSSRTSSQRVWLVNWFFFFLMARLANRQRQRGNLNDSLWTVAFLSHHLTFRKRLFYNLTNERNVFKTNGAHSEDAATTSQ